MPPPNWYPPAGWRPDPAWPPAPAGWQFWVPAQNNPATSPYPYGPPQPASTQGPTPSLARRWPYLVLGIVLFLIIRFGVRLLVHGVFHGGELAIVAVAVIIGAVAYFVLRKSRK